MRRVLAHASGGLTEREAELNKTNNAAKGKERDMSAARVSEGCSRVPFLASEQRAAVHLAVMFDESRQLCDASPFLKRG